jgi:hypothetical protein
MCLRSIFMLPSYTRISLASFFFPSHLPTNSFYIFLISLRCATRLIHLILIHLITVVASSEGRKLQSSSLYIISKLLVTSSLILISSTALNLCSSGRLTHQVHTAQNIR